MRPKLYYGLFLLAVLLVGCEAVTPETTESPLSVKVMHDQSPISPTAISQAPAGESVIPTQDAKLGSVVGSITMEGETPGTFPAKLYLGDPTGADPVGAYISLDIETAPPGYVHPDGKFVFPNVPEGLYSIVVWTPGGAFIVSDPSTGYTWLVEVTAGDAFNAGHIQVPVFYVEGQSE